MFHPNVVLIANHEENGRLDFHHVLFFYIWIAQSQRTVAPVAKRAGQIRALLPPCSHKFHP